LSALAKVGEGVAEWLVAGAEVDPVLEVALTAEWFLSACPDYGEVGSPKTDLEKKGVG
jgi:hypothetical protein